MAFCPLRWLHFHNLKQRGDHKQLVSNHFIDLKHAHMAVCLFFIKKSCIIVLWKSTEGMLKWNKTQTFKSQFSSFARCERTKPGVLTNVCRRAWQQLGVLEIEAFPPWWENIDRHG